MYSGLQASSHQQAAPPFASVLDAAELPIDRTNHLQQARARLVTLPKSQRSWLLAKLLEYHFAQHWANHCQHCLLEPLRNRVLLERWAKEGLH